MIKLKDHLYQFDTYVGLNYDKALAFMKKYQVPANACSLAQSGNYIGRNFDFNYDDHADVIIRTKAVDGRYATMGVARTYGTLTPYKLDNNQYTEEEISMMPFLVADCLNEKGVYCSINLVPVGDAENTTPIGSSGKEICQIMIPRYVCDYAADTGEAVDLLEAAVIYAPVGLNMECHAFITDGIDSVLVEFIDGEVSVLESVGDTTIMTNFYHTDWTGDIKTVTHGDTQEETEATGLTDHAQGLERYEILSEGIEDVTDVESMFELMKSVKFSLAYDVNQSPFWYSDFYKKIDDDTDYTILSTAEEMADYVGSAIEEFQNRKRNGKVWITTHTSVYDLENKVLVVASEEDFTDLITVGMDTSPLYGVRNLQLLF